ncbi:MAG: tributyrin esterase, partial [Waltera sp.]
AAANLSGLSFVTELFAEQRARYQDKEQEKNDVVSLCWGSLEELAGTDSDSKVWIDRASETGEYPALFGAIGTEDGGYAHAQKYLAYCKEKNVKIYYEEMPGGHEWKVWDTMIVKYLDWIQTL